MFIKYRYLKNPHKQDKNIIQTQKVVRIQQHKP
jgi:hypothetical protein